ncbi:MAG: LuxR family transcriptional regulator [Leucobacter sp.]
MSHISLPSLSDELLVEAEASTHGMASAFVKDSGGFRQILIRLRSDGNLPEHDNPGEAMAFVVEGAVRFLVPDLDEVHELRAGDLFTVPDARHSVEALEDSLLLLTFAPN